MNGHQTHTSTERSGTLSLEGGETHALAGGLPQTIRAEQPLALLTDVCSAAPASHTRDPGRSYAPTRHGNSPSAGSRGLRLDLWYLLLSCRST